MNHRIGNALSHLQTRIANTSSVTDRTNYSLTDREDQRGMTELATAPQAVEERKSIDMQVTTGTVSARLTREIKSLLKWVGARPQEVK